MKNKLQIFLLGIFMLCLLLAYMGCAKDETTVGPQNPNTDPNAPTYPVTVTVLNPSGTPQGGVTVTLQNPPTISAIFTAITDSLGKATIQAPAGSQVIIATMGTVFQVTIGVTVNASSTGTIILTPIKLVQITTTNKKVLVVSASAEQLEAVLRVIGFTTFDSTSINTLRDQANNDSTALLNYLKQYSLVFSDCDGSSEGSDSFAALSRTYGRYLAQGGKMYGGHYNFYHLQRIFPPYYNLSTYGDVDSLKIINTNLIAAIGYTVVKWSTVYHSLSYYEVWSDLPVGNSTVYAVMSSSVGSASSPQGIPIIVENRVGTGKYVWTAYHNQDIKNDPKLIKIVQYFLLSM